MASLPKTQFLAFLLLLGIAASCSRQDKLVDVRNLRSFQFLKTSLAGEPLTDAEEVALRGVEVRRLDGVLDGLIRDWTNVDRSPGHTEIIGKFVDQLFASRTDDICLTDTVLSNVSKTSEEILGFPGADCSTTVTRNLWSRPGQTAKVCKSAVDTVVVGFDATTGNPIKGCSSGTDTGGEDYLARCIEERLAGDAVLAPFLEMRVRAVAAYQQGSSWEDFFNNNTYLGTPVGYYMRLLQIYRNSAGAFNQTEIRTLMDAMRSGQIFAASLPVGTQGAEAMGPFGGTAFLTTYNNYRSRYNRINFQFLCRKVDDVPVHPNFLAFFDSTSSFYNPSLTSGDIDHAKRADCNRCHYPMDPQANAFAGWDARGAFVASRSTKAVGRSGAQINGIRDWVADILSQDRAAFQNCMAKRAFEFFSGESWEALPEATRRRYGEAASQGLKPLVQEIALSKELRQLRGLGE